MNEAVLALEVIRAAGLPIACLVILIAIMFVVRGYDARHASEQEHSLRAMLRAEVERNQQVMSILLAPPSPPVPPSAPPTPPERALDRSRTAQGLVRGGTSLYVTWAGATAATRATPRRTPASRADPALAHRVMR